jgi:cytochrome c oxidase subunit 2
MTLTQIPNPIHGVILAALPFPAAAGVQSALTPRGEQASLIAEISWVMFIGGTVIFLLVMVMLALALYGPPRLRALLSRRSLIVGGGVAFPVVVLTALLVYTLSTASFLVRAETPAAARIEVIGEIWWWRVRYLDSDGQPMFETANDIRIPSGLPVDFLLKSDNVIHSFWVPNLAGKIDMMPGQVNRLRVQAQAPGIFRGQCAEYCGSQHAKMMFHVEVLAPDDFQAWLAVQRQPAREPTDARLQVGRQYFMHACAQCHAIRGTAAAGTLGPDLTHVGSRHSLAAGVLPNNVGAHAGWIAGNQHIKPGNLMPSFNQLSGEGLRAVAHYMESLE